MLIILCAELEEAKNIKCSDALILITGVGYNNIIKTMPRLSLKPEDKIINIGYAGSNKYVVGSVVSVDKACKLNTSPILNEQNIKLKPCYLNGDVCYTSDNFIEQARDEVALVDMELYYLALVYPQIQSLKIVSDNLDYKTYKKTNFNKSWNKVNKILNEVANG